MNSQEKQFLDAENIKENELQQRLNESTTSNLPAFVQKPTLTNSYTYLTGMDGIGSATSSNTNYLISIPDGEITFEELNRTMNTLSNAVAHMQTKIAVMESVEKPKCKPRKLDI